MTTRLYPTQNYTHINGLYAMMAINLVQTILLFLILSN